MFRRSDVARHAACLAALAGLGFAAGEEVQAQPRSPTIAELTDAQRASINEEMRRMAAKAAGTTETVVPGPLGAAPIPVASTQATPARPTPAQRPGSADEPRLAITGQALLKGLWRVEVLTDAGVFLLGTGQAVPGTAWRVGLIEPGRVTLLRPGPRKGKSVERVFALGTL